MAPRIVFASGRSTARFNPSGSCSGTFENQDLVSGWLGSSVWSGFGNRLKFLIHSGLIQVYGMGPRAISVMGGAGYPFCARDTHPAA